MTRRIVLWWLLRGAFCTCLIAVAWLSLAPQVSLPESVRLGDKLGHVLAYAALGFTATALVSALAKLALSISVAAFGVAMEAAQAGVAGRTSDLADVVANCVGLLIGLLAAFAFERLLSRGAMRRSGPNIVPQACVRVGNAKSGRY